VVETSTLTIEAKERGRWRLAGAGIELLDCPVSGTSDQARAGDLIVFASGPAAALDRVEGVLDAFARTVYRVGDFGAGSTMKFLANTLVGIHNAAAAEVVAMAELAGVDPAVAVPVLADGAGQSRMLEVRGPGMATRAYGSGATIEVYRKDLAIIRGFAAGIGASTPLLDVVADLYQQADALGAGQDDPGAVHRVYVAAMPDPDGDDPASTNQLPPPRIASLGRKDLDEQQRQLWDAVRSSRRATTDAALGGTGDEGGLIGPFNAWLRSPKAGHAASEVGAALRFESQLDQRLLELATCIAGAHWKSNFEFVVHRRHAVGAGVSDAVLDAVERGEPPVFDREDEQAVYDCCRSLLDTARLDDATYDRVLDVLGEERLVEVVMIVGYYTLVSLTLNTFRVPPPAGTPPIWAL
jgi:alkylhydroperoxidase family enzyme